MSMVSCVVVHHKSPDTLPATVAALTAAGIKHEDLVVVDNSEDAEVTGQIRSVLDHRIQVHSTPNDGYAAAVNFGAAVLRPSQATFVLVSTHEVIPDRAAVNLLRDAMLRDSTIGVAGPTLLNRGSSGSKVWSTGGLLSPRSGLPRHSTDSSTPPTATLERAWLDGAFCLYRREALDQKLREDFFLYTEELEFHVRLRNLGWKAVWVPQAVASQSTDGTPPFLQTRNLQIFLRLWGSRPQQLLSVPFLILRETAARTVRRRSPLKALPDMIRGWRNGRAHQLEEGRS